MNNESWKQDVAIVSQHRPQGKNSLGTPWFSCSQVQPGIVVFQNSKGRRRPANVSHALQAIELHGFQNCFKPWFVYKSLHCQWITPTPQETSYDVASSMCASARNVNIPTPPHPNPGKRSLDEKKEEKQQIPMVGGHTRTRADRHPEGTTRGPIFSLLIWNLETSCLTHQIHPPFSSSHLCTKGLWTSAKLSPGPGIHRGLGCYRYQPKWEESTYEDDGRWRTLLFEIKRSFVTGFFKFTER